jgi:opacity protein-like surface antigen
MTARLVMLAALAAVAAGGAAAQDARGFYLKGFGGFSQLQGDDLELGGSLRGSSAVDYELGYVTGAAVGYAYSERLAFEVEYAYRTGDARGFDDGIARSGDYASTVVMANAIWTFAPVADGVAPYLGAGLGAATEIDFDLEGGSVAEEFSGRGDFAFQVMGGVGWDLTETWRLGAEIRYFDAGTPSLEGRRNAKLEARYNTLEGLVALSYRF